MRTKVLRYAAGRDDRIVSTFEEVTFENEYMGWYVDCPDEGGQRGWDNMAVVERIGRVCFVACFVSRMSLDSNLIKAVSNEALHLQASMQRRMAAGQWIPLPYIAAYEALGWDSRPLKCHRDAILADRERKEQEHKRLTAAYRRQQEQRQMTAIEENARRFRNGERVEAQMFIELCGHEKIALHPRTLHQLRNKVDWVTKTQIAFKSYDKRNRIPKGSGCFDAIKKLSEKINSPVTY